MSMFDDLIPKPQPPEEPRPTDPKPPSIWANAIRNQLQAGRIGKPMPTSTAKPMTPWPEDPVAPQMDPTPIAPAPTPMIAEQITTPTVAQLIASGGQVGSEMTSQDRAMLQSRLRDGIGLMDGDAIPSLSQAFQAVMDGTSEAQVLDPNNWVAETAPDPVWYNRDRMSETGRVIMKEIMGANIPEGAKSALLENPDLADEFDRKYGAGAASAVLGR